MSTMSVGHGTGLAVNGPGTTAVQFAKLACAFFLRMRHSSCWQHASGVTRNTMSITLWCNPFGLPQWPQIAVPMRLAAAGSDVV